MGADCVLNVLLGFVIFRGMGKVLTFLSLILSMMLNKCYIPNYAPPLLGLAKSIKKCPL